MNRMVVVILASMLLLCGVAVAQEEKASDEQSERPAARVEIPGPLYRMAVNVNEMDGATKVNSRAYTLMVRARGGAQEARENGYLRVGSRVPVQTAVMGPNSIKDAIQYMDIGMKVDVSNAREIDGLLMGTISIELNTVVPGEAQAGNPVLRDLRMVSPFTLAPGKPAVIGTVDDVNSKRTFQVEVTATKLR